MSLFSFLRVDKVAVLLALVVVAGSIDAANPGARPVPALAQGTGALAKGNNDSAIVYFVKAFSEGMSRDSLFYFWAEALLRKGVLDSALAANFMVSGSASGAFRIQWQLQRATIYRRLGWDGDAARILDTVKVSREYRRALLLPDVDIGISAGYGIEGRVADTAGPWGAGAGASFTREQRGPFARADFRSVWKPIQGECSLSAGVAGSFSHRQYNPTGALHSADSTDIIGSLFASVAGKTAACTYTLSGNRRIDDSLFVGNGIEGGVAGKSVWMPLLWGGSTVFLSKEGRFGNARAWLFGSAQRNLGKRLKVDWQLFVNSYFERASSFGFTLATARMLFAEDARWQYPVFYTDGSYSQVIDTAAYLVLTGKIVASGHDTMFQVGLKQPFSNLQINPRFALTLRNALPVQIGFSWRWNYYWEPYEWDQITAYPKYLIYSRADAAYYFISGSSMMITRGDDRELAIAPAALPLVNPPVLHHSARRIDNTISADIAVQMYDGRFGAAMFKASASKTWSTLSKRSPVEIPEWAVAASLEWRLKIVNKRIQH